MLLRVVLLIKVPLDIAVMLPPKSLSAIILNLSLIVLYAMIRFFLTIFRLISLLMTIFRLIFALCFEQINKQSAEKDCRPLAVIA